MTPQIKFVYSSLLVAARTDINPVRLNRPDVERLRAAAGFVDYLETSAKTGRNVAELRERITEAIDWSAVSYRSSPAVFRRLKTAIIGIKDRGHVLTTVKQLLDWLPGEVGPFTLAELQTVIDLLAGPGAVMRLGFDDQVLLQPELLNTYGQTVIPVSFNSWEKPYTVIDRMRRGKPVIIPGDGTSLWQLTHNEDFAIGLVGLLGHQSSIGHAFHITTDEVLNWNQIYQATAEAAGVDQLDVVHIASDFIVACLPDAQGGLHGDKSASVVLDNSKIKRFVPDFVATRRYRDGIKRSIAWYDADPARCLVDEATDATHDRLIAAYRKGLDDARAALSHL